MAEILPMQSRLKVAIVDNDGPRIAKTTDFVTEAAAEPPAPVRDP